MTITQTVDIPANRRVRFDFEVPHEIPEGKAQIEFKVIPFGKKEEKPADNGKICLTRKELDDMAKKSPTLHKISGILSDLGEVDLDEIRMTRLAKHL